jgi:hypothetical protein
MRKLLCALLLVSCLGFLNSVWAGGKFFGCQPTQIGAFGERVHVRCQTSDQGIYYFAVPSAQAELANRTLSIAGTAIAFNKSLMIYYDPAVKGTEYGCAANDCRPLIGILLNK